MPRHRNAILVGRNVRVRPVWHLLQVRGKLEKRQILAGCKIFSSLRRCAMARFFKEINLCEKDNKEQVDNNGNPRGFPSTRTREIVLQLNKQMRHARIVIQIAVSRLPSCAS